MISGNKGFKKQSVSKGHRTKHSAITFRNDRNKRPKKKGNPLAGVKILPETKIEVLLHTEEPKLKQQEIEMTDMQTALAKVIGSWDDEPATDNTIPEVPQVEIKSNASVSQTVFDYVRDNPNATRANIAYALTKRGYNNSTVVALVSQFIRQKLFVFGAGKGLIVTRKTYTPMYHRDNKPAKPAVVVPQGLAAIVHQPLITRTPEAREQWMPSAPPEAEAWTVESVVDKLNIRQARAVYIELRTLLGVE